MNDRLGSGARESMYNNTEQFHTCAINICRWKWRFQSRRRKVIFKRGTHFWLCGRKWDVCTNWAINCDIVSRSMSGRNNLEICSLTSAWKTTKAKLYQRVVDLSHRKTNFNRNLWAAKANLHTWINGQRMEPWPTIKAHLFMTLDAINISHHAGWYRNIIGHRLLDEIRTLVSFVLVSPLNGFKFMLTDFIFTPFAGRFHLSPDDQPTDVAFLTSSSSRQLARSTQKQSTEKIEDFCLLFVSVTVGNARWVSRVSLLANSPDV